MSRMSQGILVAFLVFLWASGVGAWERLLSLQTAPDGTPLKAPMSATWGRGRIYVVDTGNHRLISYSLEGKPLKAVNPGGRLKDPLDLAFDGQGRLWVVERS